MAQETCPNCNETIAPDTDACPACGHLHQDRNCANHPHREADGQCVICGRALCDTCNRPQGHHFVCEQHAEVPVVSGWAQLFSAADDIEAELIRENLSAEGIESRVLSQRDHFAMSVNIGDFNQVRVLVPAFEYMAARDLIDSHTDEAGEVTFACPNCGEAYDEGQSRCATCGEELPGGARHTSP